MPPVRGCPTTSRNGPPSSRTARTPRTPSSRRKRVRWSCAPTGRCRSAGRPCCGTPSSNTSRRPRPQHASGYRREASAHWSRVHGKACGRRTCALTWTRPRATSAGTTVGRSPPGCADRASASRGTWAATFRGATTVHGPSATCAMSTAVWVCCCWGESCCGTPPPSCRPWVGAARSSPRPH